ncbi:MAG: glycosyltransferase [Bifidobacteriaceae bacterium]|nr:glycosyltransferase [Bifidobacteriaceae bacterium]MCI1978992.1 glycosyltransferase [Bifidobacteriaceae bacterium]
MMLEPLVSIVMPVYNVHDFLDTSLRCAVEQTYGNVEIVVVDDGSTDDSLDIATGWAKRDSRIRIVRQDNGGVAAARNTGLYSATGDYIYFFDPDDTMELDLIERCMEAMSNFDADVVMFKFDTINVTGASIKSSYAHNEYDGIQVLSPTDALRQQLHSDIAGYLWTFVAKASIYREQNLTFPVGRKIEDLARICNILGESQKVVRLPQTLYHYRLRSGSLMGQIAPSLISDWSKAVEDREDYILTRYPSLKRYMIMQSMAFFSNLDYESMRQSLIFGLKLDPASVERRANQRLEKKNNEQKKALAKASSRKAREPRYYGSKKRRAQKAETYASRRFSQPRRAIKKFTHKLRSST